MRRSALLQLSPVCLVALLVCAWLAAPARAQSGGNYQITQSAVTGGGGTTANGSFSMTGTIGQGVAGTSSGGGYTLEGGFGAAVAPTPGATISGRVTLASNGASLASVTITLTKPDTTTTTTATDASGNYSFAGLPPGDYIVTPSKTNYSFSPASSQFTLSTANQIGVDFKATTTATASASAGSILISEFRLQGPVPVSQSAGNTQGELDEFIELYNNTNADIVLTGYSIDTSAGFTVALPGGATIPARGHYLVANLDGYSLSSYAAPDATYSGFDLQPGTGLALLDASGRIVDAAGFAATPSPYREGNGIADVSGPGQYSFVRKLTSGSPFDSNDNASDFVFVAADADTYGRDGATGTADGPAVLGMPGPEGRQSPSSAVAFKTSLIDPTAPSSLTPNQVRDGDSYTDALTPSAPDGVLSPTQTPYAHGTLSIQRRFVNKTGAAVSHLRFRVVDMTTLGSPGSAVGGQADLRLLSSDGTVKKTGGTTVVVVGGLTLEQSASQSLGGGLNSTVAAGTITLAAPLAPNNSVDVQFLLGVVQTGSFRFFVVVEAAP